MLISLALALGLTLPQAGDPSTRSPSEAFIAAIDRVCPLYMKPNGLTAADIALLEVEMAMRGGMVGMLKQGSPPPEIMLQAGSDHCLVLSAADETADAPEPPSTLLTDAVKAWLSSPDSGWTPAPTDEKPGRYLNSGGEHELLLIDQPDDGGAMVLIQALAPSVLTDVDSRVEARKQASARPVDQAILEAINTLCAVAATPAWSAIDYGEIVIRHSGSGRLTVNYQPRGDCMVRAEGQNVSEIDEIAQAVAIRLEAPGSGWTRAEHAWMMPSGNPPIGPVLANYRHDDGRELLFMMDETALQAILWQPHPRRLE